MTLINKFQFQYGSIKRRCSTNGTNLISRFQFQYGSIKSPILINAFTFIFKFQFQYGSIKSDKLEVLSKFSSVFQFQYGSIKRSSVRSSLFSRLNFNSNMVRLKVIPNVTTRRSIKISIPIWFD